VGGRLSVGQYVLHDEIASGGMGAVHIGRSRGHGGFARTVAIKRLHSAQAQDPEFAAQFLKEARLASRIHHPNVVPTLDVVAGNGELLLVMEYVHGCSLAQAIRGAKTRRWPVPPAVATSILAQALRGLHAAHEARSETGERLDLVHRDVSPQNILVDSEGIARLVDFGVAKAAGYGATTREGHLKGKLAYMAPEQVSLGVVDRRTDVYAAAIVLWELLAGERLFASDTEATTFVRVSRGGAPPIASRSSVAPELAAVVDRALSVAPDDRFPTAIDMALALEQCGPATAAEVAAWLASVCTEQLARSSELIAAIEREEASERSAPSAAAPAPAPSTARAEEPTVTSFDRPPRKRTRSLLAGAGALALLVGAVALYAARISGRTAAEPNVSVAAKATASVPGPETSPSAASITPLATTEAPSATATASARPTRPRGTTAPAARSASAKAAEHRCRVEAFTGSDGFKHYREVCP